MSVKCNKKYIQFLIDAWGWYNGEEPTPVPDDNPIPPKPYEKEKEQQPELTIYDPTYLGTPVRAQMPGLEYDKTEAIVLKR